ncbi:2493_t:CDS:2 [Funneliformis geosporum]|uniref:12787_t:CDS:1 n=1 Tax=Funneliformis geosporum TaxID=1117311 RepID=A0A9W4WLP1_9GLOM|nr:2493_t:CDS:2 [Funneliformis geosporum]CAI2170799.1 12787_t:CDS:2 [Funneliformis geosporum]
MVNRAIKSIVDQNRVSSLFRETFTGPSCLYHWLINHRTKSFLRRNLSYIQKTRRKVVRTSNIKQRERRFTLEDLCKRREQEEKIVSTSRVQRTLQLTFDGLVAYASHSPGNRSRLHIECEINLFEVSKKKLPSNIMKKRKLNNGKFDLCDFQLIHRSTVPLVMDENGCSVKETLVIEPFSTNLSGDNSQDVVIGFRLYAINSQSWPPVRSDSLKKLINGEKKNFHLIPNLVDCSDGRRILCTQMIAIEDGKFCNEDHYELGLNFAREKGSIIESNWKMRFSVNWEYKVHLPLKPMMPKPVPITQNDDPPVTFIYRVADCELHQAVRGFRCPWCLNLFKDNTCLMIHLRNNHMHLKFGIKNGKQPPSDRVIVVNSNDDLSELDFFDIDKREGTWNPKPFVYPVKRYTTTPVALSSLPSQTFYHSHTFMPFIGDENVNDSEDDICTHWVEQLNDETLDEISDVNDKEKLMMKIWNRFIEPQKGLADRNLPEVCIQFSKTRGDLIISLDLRNEFAFHLLNILEFQLIDSQCVAKCLSYVDKVKHNKK